MRKKINAAGSCLYCAGRIGIDDHDPTCTMFSGHCMIVNIQPPDFFNESDFFI